LDLYLLARMLEKVTLLLGSRTVGNGATGGVRRSLTDKM
jgi:hypothetical protein